MSEDIDPAAVMVEHADHAEVAFCRSAVRTEDEPYSDRPSCLPYRLAEALAAEQAKSARVAELAHRFELVPRARLLGALTARPPS